MNICIITSSYPLNSQDNLAAPFLPQFAVELRKNGHQVFIFTQEKRGRKEEVEGLNVIWFKWWGGNKPLANFNLLSPLDFLKISSFFLSGRVKLLDLIRKKDIDVCLALWTVPCGLLAYFAKRKLGIPYGIWSLGSDINTYGNYPIVKNILRKVLVNTDHLFANSLSLAEKIKGISAQDCSFLPSARRLPSGEKSQILPNKSETNFIYIGRLERVKGIDILMKSIVALIKKTSKVNLYIIGKGSLKSFVIKMIEENHLQNHIFLIPPVGPEVLASYLDQCDCLVIPSRRESLPVVFAEALQMGKNVITTDVGDLGYFTRKYKVGSVIPPENAEALEAEMENFLAGKMERNIQGTRELLSILDIRTSAEEYLRKVTK